MSDLTSRAFWAATVERAVRTAAQTAIATIGTTALIEEVDWAVVGSTTGLAVVLAVLTAVAAGSRGGGPALGGAEQLRPTQTHRADPLVGVPGDTLSSDR